MGGGVRSFILGVLIVAATTCLVLGLTLPIVRLTRFYVWTDVHSLISIVTELYNAHEFLLAIVICLFSVVFPFVKLLYLLALYSARHWNPERQGRFLRRMGWLGKWSMLDVLVLALVIFYAKSTKLADAVSMPGIYLFAAAVVLTMLAYAIVEYEIEQAALSGDRDDHEEQRPGIEKGEAQVLRPALGGPRAKARA
jgi:paraquat-inducible protein A